MTQHIYRAAEVIGISPQSVEAAVSNGIARAAATSNLDWFDVTSIRGHIQDGVVTNLQIGLKLGLRIDDDPSSELDRHRNR